MLKLLKSEKYPVPWITNEEEKDFMAHIHGYTLRVESMDSGDWWWQVSLGDQVVFTPFQDYAESKERAIALAEGVFFGHSSNVKKTVIVPSRMNSNDQ